MKKSGQFFVIQRRIGQTLSEWIKENVLNVLTLMMNTVAYQARNQRTVFVSSIFPFHADPKYLCFDNNNL